jgi:tetratricopeptide (TPR) repeat protein
LGLAGLVLWPHLEIGVGSFEEDEMDARHPDHHTLERFACGDLSDAENRRIERHLRSGCATCQSEVDRLLVPLAEDPVAWREWVDASASYLAEDPAALARTFDRLERRLSLIELERAAAPDLLVELLEHPRTERFGVLRARPEIHTLAACELLVERSFEAGFTDPARALELAELAVEASDCLPADRYGSSVVQDLKARAWAYLGNARRLNGDLTGAEQALAYAESLADDGSSDPLEEARILDLRAALLADQGWLEEAAELLDLSIEIYREVRDPHRTGRAMIWKGIVEGNAGDPRRAIRWIESGLSLLEPRRESYLARIAAYHLTWFLNDCGRSDEAAAGLAALRRAAVETPEPWTGFRLTWLEGRIAAGSGHFAAAEEALREARRRFLERGLGYDASMVTLDLATLFLRQGRSEEVQRLADEMFPLFVARDVHRQAIAALVAFKQAAEMERITLGLVQEIGAYLLRARRNPKLCFETGR